MSLVAIVHCRCFEDGQSSMPPFPRDVIGLKPDGSLDINLPDGEEKERLKRAQYAWERNCCPHAWRHLINEWVASWWGVRFFHNALQGVGKEAFPVLSQQIPTVNNGLILATDSAKALDELALFEQKIVQGLYQLVCLQDAGTKEELFIDDPQKGRGLCMGSEVDLWLKGDGFLITQPDDNAILFRSMHFEQVIRTIPSTGGKETIFTDKTSGCIYKVNGDVYIHSGVNSMALRSELEVLKRVSTLADFEYIVAPLKKLLIASIQTGNPVVWC